MHALDNEKRAQREIYAQNGGSKGKFENDNLSLLLDGLRRNNKLKVCSLISLRALISCQSVSLRFPVLISPESVRLIAKKYHLEELRLLSLDLRLLNRLCDQAFAYFVSANPFIQKCLFMFYTHEDGSGQLDAFVDAFLLPDGSSVPILSLHNRFMIVCSFSASNFPPDMVE